MVIDHTLNIQYSNTAARRLLGLGEDYTGQRMDRCLREIDWRRVMDADAKEWERMSLQEIEVFYPVHRFLTFYLVPFREDTDRKGTFPLAILIIHDVTELHEGAQKNLESKKVETLTMLTASVAHEIGNPLNSLTIHLQLLQRLLDQAQSPENAGDARELVDVALHEVNRLDSIVSNFLRAVRPVQPELEKLNVQPVLTAVVEFMRREIEDRNVLVEVVWPEAVPTIMGDSNQLRQAFYNVLKNAIQAMPDGGVLRIAGEEHGNFLEIRFADTGKGIARQAFPQILEPYFTTKTDGTGLGLMIVERIVRNHGGELGIDTVAGSGTIFTIRLPLHERKIRLLRAATPPPAPSSGGPCP
jgi:signal transduction histidine kinase